MTISHATSSLRSCSAQYVPAAPFPMITKRVGFVPSSFSFSRPARYSAGMPRRSPAPLARVRRFCLSLPETSERASHGAPRAGSRSGAHPRADHDDLGLLRAVVALAVDLAWGQIDVVAGPRVEHLRAARTALELHPA